MMRLLHSSIYKLCLVSVLTAAIPICRCSDAQMSAVSSENIMVPGKPNGFAWEFLMRDHQSMQS